MSIPSSYFMVDLSIILMRKSVAVIDIDPEACPPCPALLSLTRKTVSILHVMEWSPYGLVLHVRPYM